MELVRYWDVPPSYNMWIRPMFSVDTRPAENALQSEVIAFFHAHLSVQEAPFDASIVASLLVVFDKVWREVANESFKTESERAEICDAAVNAVIALAEAGLQPEHIKRFAMSKLRHALAGQCAGAKTRQTNGTDSRGCRKPEPTLEVGLPQ